jgi:hypothetical protein
VEEFTLTEKGWYRGKVRLNFRNTSEIPQQTAFCLQVSPAGIGDYQRGMRTLTLESLRSTFVDYEVILPPGKYVFAIQSDDVNVNYAWTFVPLNWVLQETEDLKGLPEFEFVNYYGNRTKGLKASVHGGSLLIQSDVLKDKNNSLVIYAAEQVERRDGEVVFSVEETDFGVVPAVISGRHGLEPAPQLRCPLEITLVFKNEPKVKEVRKVLIPGGEKDIVRIPFENLGLKADTKHFWLEIEARTKEVEKYRYPHTLFHSVTPETSAHMYADVIIP